MKGTRYIYDIPAMEDIETAAMAVVCVNGGAISVSDDGRKGQDKTLDLDF